MSISHLWCEQISSFYSVNISHLWCEHVSCMVLTCFIHLWCEHISSMVGKVAYMVWAMSISHLWCEHVSSTYMVWTCLIVVMSSCLIDDTLLRSHIGSPQTPNILTTTADRWHTILWYSIRIEYRSVLVTFAKYPILIVIWMCYIELLCFIYFVCSDRSDHNAQLHRDLELRNREGYRSVGNWPAS